MARFAREARAASRLRGDHVVRILDVDDSDEGDPFLVMEFLEGTDLQEHLKGVGPLSVEDATAIMLQACEGLAEAHAAGIVHRDLKPANLFLTTRADGSRLVKILDFGISKAPEPEEMGTFQITKPATAIGSPSYMSPEQLKNAADVDARTDIWALGVVLYQLLTGALPFEATGTAELAARIAADPPIPLRSLRPDVPEALDAIVTRCLEKKALDRFSDIVELARALAPFAPGGSSGAIRVARVAEMRAVRDKEKAPSTPPPPASPAFPRVDAPPHPGTASLPAHVASPLVQALGTEYGSTVRAEPTGARTAKRPVAPIIGAALVLGIAGTWYAARGEHRPAQPSGPPRMESRVDAPPAPSTDDAQRAPESSSDAGRIVVSPSASVRPSNRAPRASGAAPKSTAPSKDNPMEIDFR